MWQGLIRGKDLLISISIVPSQSLKHVFTFFHF